jgi:hypothetical protein
MRRRSRHVLNPVTASGDGAGGGQGDALLVEV